MPTMVTTDVGPVRILTLNRPEVRNALSTELRAALLEQLDRAASEPDIRAVVLTGAGSVFCAGLDLAELETMLDRTPEEHREDARSLADLLLRIYLLPKPVIAALNGHAVAGGAGLASVCDLVVAGESTRMGYSEVRIGFVAALVAVFLVRQIGERRARELLLDARLIGAHEALAFGMINEVVPDGEVLARSVERAKALCSNAPQALALTKNLLADITGEGLDDALQTAIEINTASRASGDLREGIRAFFARRPPSWLPEGAADSAG